MIVQGRYSRLPDARSGRLQTKRRGRRSVAVHAGEHHEQHGAIVVGDHGAIAEVRLEVLGVGRRGVFSVSSSPPAPCPPQRHPSALRLVPRRRCAGRLRGGGEAGTWPGGQPREAAASSLYLTPHALHRVFGPSGPLRHSGVFCVRQLAHTFPAHGQARRPPEAGRRRRRGGREGVIAGAGMDTAGGATLSPAGEAMRALSSRSDGTLVICNGGG